MTQHTKVLVVDDHEQRRDRFCKVLTSAGYAVRAAADGMNAIRHLEETRFDVVLTNVVMPQMDGLELLTKILDRWPDSRVEGAYACLTKSYDTAQLLKTIEAASSTP